MDQEIADPVPVPEGFEVFWKVYPRLIERMAAIRAYRKALKITTPNVILVAAMQYAQERRGQDMQFTKHPASWLNAQFWADFGQPAPIEKSSGFYATFTSPELDAWEAYGKSTRKRGYPRDKNGGWFFPTRWPPGFGEPKQEPAE